MGKKIAKFVGIGMLCVFGVLGIGIGIFALTGGFDQTVVVLTTLYFDETSQKSDGYIMNIQDIRTSDELALSTKKYIVISDDYSIELGCLPADATNKNLEVTVSQVTPAIEVEKTTKVGSAFNIKVKKDAKGNNIGGSAKLSFKSNGGVSCELYVIVDVILNDADIKLDVGSLPQIHNPGSSEILSSNSYVLARKNGSQSITLSSDLVNAFKINQSNISNKDFTDNSVVKFFDKKVYVYADQPEVVEVVKNATAPVTYTINLNLENVDGSYLNLFVRTHRSYQMQQDFEADGLNAFYDFYVNKNYLPDSEGHNQLNTDKSLNYSELITKYNNFINKYKDEIIKDRRASEFFTKINISQDPDLIVLSESGDLFLTQVWESLKYVFVNSDISFFVSDIDISSMTIGSETIDMNVFDIQSYTLQELADKYISIENEDSTVAISKEEKLALLSNMKVGVYVIDTTDENKEFNPTDSFESIMKEAYNVAKLENGNGVYCNLTSIENLYANKNFLNYYTDANKYYLEALVPSKYADGDKVFKIYLAFSLSITKSTGENVIFYDFLPVNINYENEVSYEQGTPASNLTFEKNMCVNTSERVSNVFNGAINSQTIEINMKQVLGKNNIYGVPKLFIEKTSNQYSYINDLSVMVGDEVKSVGKNGDTNIAYSIIDIKDCGIRRFVEMKGYNDSYYVYKGDAIEASALEGYEIPVYSKYEQTGLNADKDVYYATIVGKNSLNEHNVNFFWACVLRDENGNPIDRDGNRLFNDKGQAIENGDFGLVKEIADYVVVYSSLDASGTDLSFGGAEIQVSSILENLYFYSNTSEDFIYEEKTSGKLYKVQSDDLFLRNNRTDDVDINFTKLKLVAKEEYIKALKISGFKLVMFNNAIVPYFTAEEYENSINNGIDIYGNIINGLTKLVNEEVFEFRAGDETLVEAELIDGNPDDLKDGDLLKVKNGEGFYLNLNLNVFSLDDSSEKSTCVLSLNPNLSYDKYGIINDVVTIDIDSPVVKDISTIIRRAGGQEGLEEVAGSSYKKQIFINGALSSLANAKAGDIEYNYNYDIDFVGAGKTESNEVFTFYSAKDVYKVCFEISSENSNMILLKEYYLNTLNNVLAQPDLSDNLGEKGVIEYYTDANNNLNIERLNELNNAIETLNQGRVSKYIKFNPRCDENIIDSIVNNENYINEYLNGLIKKVEEIADIELNITSIDECIDLLQNYGISIKVDENTETKKYEVFGSAIGDTSISDLETAIERLKEYINAHPRYDADFIGIRTVVNDIYSYDLDLLVERVNTIRGLSLSASDRITEIIKVLKDNFVLIDDSSDMFDIIKVINDEIKIYNENFAEELTNIPNPTVIANYANCFEEGRYDLASKELILNADGTLPLKSSMSDNIFMDLGLQFRFYPKTSGGVQTYRYTIEKKHLFYINFQPVDLEFNNGVDTIELNAGESISIDGIINAIGFDGGNGGKNHIKYTILPSFQDKIHFKNAENQAIYSVYGNSEYLTVYANSLVGTDTTVQIEVSLPYSDKDGNQIKKYIKINIKHNIDVTINNSKVFIGAINTETVREIDLSDYITSNEGFSIEYSFGGNDYVTVENNKLLVKYLNMQMDINLTVNIKNGDEVVYTFKQAISINPYHKILFKDYNNLNADLVEYQGNYYIKTPLLTGTDLYKNNWVHIYEFNEETLSYVLLDVSTNLDKIKSIINLTFRNQNYLDIPDMEVFGVNVLAQFYDYINDKYEDGVLTKEGVDASILNNGILNIPDFAKNIVIPIKVNINGYYGERDNIYIFVNVLGTKKYINKDGKGNVDNVENTYSQASYDSNEIKQDFKYSQDGELKNLKLKAGQTYNLAEYIQVLLNTATNSKYNENTQLRLTYKLGNELAGISLDNKANEADEGITIMVDGSEVAINDYLRIDSSATGTITLVLTGYVLTSSNVPITYQEIFGYNPTITIEIEPSV